MLFPIFFFIIQQVDNNVYEPDLFFRPQSENHWRKLHYIIARAAAVEHS